MLSQLRYSVASALLLLAGTASAAIFEFSYKYSSSGGDHEMTGIVSGVRNDNGTSADGTDDFVLTPTVLSAAFNNVPMISSPLLLRVYDDLGMQDDVVPNIYFAVSSNNFIISPCGVVQCVLDAYGDPSTTIDIFFLRAFDNPGVQYYSELDPLVAFNDRSSSAGTWLLSEVRAVPEPSSYALFACGAAILWATRRRGRVQAEV